MKVLQLTVFVSAPRANASSELSFLRSPVMVGREQRGGIQLDAPTVSRRHGEFRFDSGGVQYIDLGSANGTYVDGVRVEPNLTVDLRDSSVIDIFPFRLMARVDLVSPRREIAASATKTAVDDAPPTPSPVREWSEELARSTNIQRLFLQHGTVPLFRRATLALEIVAKCIAVARSTAKPRESALPSFGTSAELVAYLIDPVGGEQRLQDFGDLLATLLEPATTGTQETS